MEKITAQAKQCIKSKIAENEHLEAII